MDALTQRFNLPLSLPLYSASKQLKEIMIRRVILGQVQIHGLVRLPHVNKKIAFNNTVH